MRAILLPPLTTAILPLLELVDLGNFVAHGLCLCCCWHCCLCFVFFCSFCLKPEISYCNVHDLPEEKRRIMDAQPDSSRVSARTPIAPGEYICCWNSAVTIQLFLV